MKITKDEFENIMAEAIAAEMAEFTEKTGSKNGAVLAIGLMGASIGCKIRRELFKDEDEIEIVTDKE